MTPGEPGPLDLLFVGTLPPHRGGSAISAGQILAGLARQGHRVRAIAPMTADAMRDRDRFAHAHLELEVVRFPVPHFNETPNIPSSDVDREREGAQVQAILERLVRARRPDVVFIGRETYAWHLPQLTCQYDLPCVLRLPGVTSYGALSGAYPAELAARLLDRYRQAALLISPGRHLAERLSALGFGPIMVIPTAIDLQEFSPRPKPGHLLARLAIGPEDIVVAMVANLKALKRPLDVVASARMTLGQDPRLLYVLVGDGPLRPQVEAASQAAGVESRFRFVGWEDYGALPDYLNLADVVVVPSEYEGLARVYIEAQACGRVLIASDIPPAREVIEEGVTGLLFALGDVRGLATATLAAAADPELRIRIGRQALARTAAHGLASAVDDYQRALVEVVARHRARRRSGPDRRRRGTC
jgi:glycosyltransferase involved in cell wall biosynthesis